MQPLDDKTYFAERERASRKMATETADPTARTVHLKLAELYALRAQPDVPAEPAETEDR